MVVPERESPSIKGSVLVARMKYVRDKGGEAALAKVLGRLSHEHQQALRGIVLTSGWYPLELNLRLDDAIADVLSPTNRAQAFIEMGRASADVNLRGPHRTYLREGDPHHLLQRAPAIHASYYATGRCTYEKTGDKSGVLRAYDIKDSTATDCLTAVGWYQRAIELSGGKNVRVTQVKCRTKGDAFCEYRCEWA